MKWCPDCGDADDPIDNRWMSVGTVRIHRCSAGIERRNEESRRYAEEKDRELREDHYAERDAQFLAWIEEEREACGVTGPISRRSVLDRLAARFSGDYDKPSVKAARRTEMDEIASKAARSNLGLRDQTSGEGK